MARRLLIVLGMIAALSTLTGAWLFAQAKNGNVPPFSISSDKMTFNVNNKDKAVTYAGHVNFVSPENSTTITCERLEANAKEARNVTSITATGNVLFKSVVTNEKDKTKTRIDGKSEKTTYTLEDGKRVVRMVKSNGVLPTLVITDLSDPKAEPYKIVGEVIEYNLDSGDVSVEKQVTTHGGGGQ